MEQCKYCKQMFKQIVRHVNRCPEKQGDLEIPGMAPCPYCQKMFKQLSGHLYQCPKNVGNKQKPPQRKESSSEDESVDLTPCPHCKKDFKRLAAHIYRCPENKQKTTARKMKKSSSSGDESADLTPCPHCKKDFKRLGAHIYRCPENAENKQKTSAIKMKKSSSSEDEATDLTPCPHCKKDFKRLAAHIYRCPENAENKQKTSAIKMKKSSSSGDEATNLTPCPHCKKDFKRLAAHIYRCPENAENKQKMSAIKMKKSSSSGDEATDLIPCPHCKKDFKRLAAHIYRCPENGENKQKMSTKKITKKSSTSEDEVTDLTPCPHCKKQFKQLASHIYRCPENAESKQKTSGKMTKKKSSSEDEATNLILSEEFTSDEDVEDGDYNYREEVEGAAAAKDMQLCPYCKKIFKRFEDHVSSCPECPELNLEMPQKQTTKNHLSSGNTDRGDFASKKPCPHCQLKFGMSLVHTFDCPILSNKMVKLEDDLDNTTHFNLNTDQRSSVLASSLFYSSPSPQLSEAKMAHIGEVTSQLARPPIHVNYISGPKQKKLEKINPTLNGSTSDHYSVSSYKSWETESGSTSVGLKRLPIHDEYTLEHGLHIGRDERDLMDSHEEIFSRLSESDDSFSYLHQDLKRPPINQEKSPRTNDADKMVQFNNNEEELFQFHRHVSRE